MHQFLPACPLARLPTPWGTPLPACLGPCLRPASPPACSSYKTMSLTCFVRMPRRLRQV